MNNLIELFIFTVVAVVCFTVIYKLMPYKIFSRNKPKFTLFPKYMANFDKPVSDIESALLEQKFTKNEDGSYSRGKIYGDFSIKSIKLKVIIDENKKSLNVYAPFFGILFDTGDLWQVTANIVNDQPSK